LGYHTLKKVFIKSFRYTVPERDRRSDRRTDRISRVSSVLCCDVKSVIKIGNVQPAVYGWSKLQVAVVSIHTVAKCLTVVCEIAGSNPTVVS